MKLKEREIRMYDIVMIIGIFLVLVFGAENWREKRVLKKIVITGNEVLKRGDILKLADVRIGEKLFDVQLDAIRRRIEKHRFVKLAHVYRNLPDVLIIEVIERRPVAMINSRGRIYLLDEDGNIMRYEVAGRVFNVPLISGSVKSRSRL
jgi:cell division protein FtsQ